MYCISYLCNSCTSGIVDSACAAALAFSFNGVILELVAKRFCLLVQSRFSLCLVLLPKVKSIMFVTA